MSKPLKKKSHKQEPTIKQKKAFTALMENHGNMAEALRAAGYAPNSVKNPQTIRKSKAFSQMLEEVGLTDRYLAKKHRQLMNSSRLEEHKFFSVQRSKKRWTPVTDMEIVASIEGPEDDPTGAKVVFIKDNPYEKCRIAMVRHPDNVVQKGMLEMASKIKGHFSPERIQLVDSDLSEDEEQTLANLFGAK